MTNVVPFDTLALASALRDEAGLDQQQAEGFARVLSRALVGDMATKADLRETETRLEAKIEKTVSEAKADLLKSILAVVMVAATLNTALVLGAMFGLAKLLGH